jgi:hypothetical protein
MHELLRDLTQTETRPILTRLPLDDGALIAAFAAGEQRLLWVAKTAQGESACRRLAAEARALRQLAPWAATLNVPHLLAWREYPGSCEPQACLVQSAVAGKRRSCWWNLRRPWAKLPSAVTVAANWISRFQRMVNISALGFGPTTLAELAEDEQPWPGQRRTEGEYASLLAAVPAMGAPAPGLPTVAVHGDFWIGNLLWQAPWRIGVVDWNGLSAGSAIDDLLAFLANLPCRSGRRRCSRLAGWQALWFSPGRPRDLLRAFAADAGYREAEARSAFYLFLRRRMRWELGYGLQRRDHRDKHQAAREWEALITWLAEHRFPDPFTPMPV